jgi:3-phosphoinositide dependent protein kinase-1
MQRDTYPVPPGSPGLGRVTIAVGDSAHPRSASISSSPATPTRRKASDGDASLHEPRERRHSQLSTGSNASSASRRPSLRDFILGDELGRGSYSTVSLLMIY